jgi:hypothetical protein
VNDGHAVSCSTLARSGGAGLVTATIRLYTAVPSSTAAGYRSGSMSE